MICPNLSTLPFPMYVFGFIFTTFMVSVWRTDSAIDLASAIASLCRCLGVYPEDISETEEKGEITVHLYLSSFFTLFEEIC